MEDEHGIGEVITRYCYGGGTAIYAEGGWYYPPTFPFRMNFLVRMERATVEYDPGSKPFTVYPEDGEPFTPEIAPADAYQQEIAYFLECVASGNGAKMVTPWDARESRPPGAGGGCIRAQRRAGGTEDAPGVED